MIRHVTRFTEEIFALIIALVYLYEPFKKLYKVRRFFIDFTFIVLLNILDISFKSGSIYLQLRLSIIMCL